MKKLFGILTFLITALNLTCLVYFYPHVIRVNDSKFDKVVEESKLGCEKLDNLSKQMISEYPDLPKKVKMLLEEYPDLASERVDVLETFANSNKGFITILFFNSLFFVFWGSLTFLYFRRRLHMN